MATRKAVKDASPEAKFVRLANKAVNAILRKYASLGRMTGKSFGSKAEQHVKINDVLLDAHTRAIAALKSGKSAVNEFKL